MNVQVRLDTESNAKIRRMIELARGHMEAGGVTAAGAYYRMILKDTSPPKSGVERIAHGEACVWYARKSLAEGHAGAAADWYQQALRADPLANDYRIEYCVKALLPMGLHKNARIELERATRIDPASADAWRKLGGIEHALGNAAAAVEAYDRALALTPDDPYARTDRATIALDTADYGTIREMCEPCLRGKLRGDALHLLAMAEYRLGHHESAILLYDAAIADGCDDPELATWNKSLALHSIGRYREGWAAHEARGRQKTDKAMALVMNRFTAPRWEGEPALIDDKICDRSHTGPLRLHLHQEMGHGDVIAMARYVPLLLERGYDVRVEVMDSMVGLLQRSFPEAKVMPKAVDYPGAMGIPLFDYHLPMLSLPAVFGTDVDTVPWHGPYLKPDPELVGQYRAKLPANKRKIGLCWSSGLRQEGLWISEYGRRKSMKFETLWPVVEACTLPMVETGNGAMKHTRLMLDHYFVSLQVGPERQERRDPVVDLLPAKPSWDDTAALVECLDLVVTVDTSVAHLAGALGKPVLLLMHTEGSWHWMTKRLDSPWYPSAKLYRQSVPHQWSEVIAAVSADLVRG